MAVLLRQLDDLVYACERVLIVVLLALMSFVVFLDVVHRLSATEGPLDKLCARLLPASMAGPSSAILASAVTFLLVYGALRTARVANPPAKGAAAALAAGAVVLGYAAVKLLLAVFPSGLVWSQVSALSGMLWVGFLGASAAAKEGSHLTLEIMEFVWKGKAKAHVGRIGSLAAASFAMVLAYLCARYVHYHYREWVEADGLAGVFDGFAVPKFAVYAILPVTLTVIGLRFLALALGPTEQEKEPSLKPLQMPPDGALPTEGKES